MANWSKITTRGTVDDRRGLAPVIGSVSLVGIALMFALSYLNGGDLESAFKEVASTVLEQQLQQQGSTNEDTSQFAGEDAYEVFAATVLGSNNETWQTVFPINGKDYLEPKLVLFRQATQSGCGIATSDVGPHYCPADQTIYLDETFFDELTTRFGAQGGDVAQAYVIAHEVGHHVQNILGTLEKTASGNNDTSVKIELQADCFAGIWANSIRDQGILEQDEIREAMDAAAAVGDDRIQERVQGYSDPETFTHGSADERVAWFTKGYETGEVGECQAFD